MSKNAKAAQLNTMLESTIPATAAFALTPSLRECIFAFFPRTMAIILRMIDDIGGANTITNPKVPKISEFLWYSLKASSSLISIPEADAGCEAHDTAKPPTQNEGRNKINASPIAIIDNTKLVVDLLSL